VADLRERRQAAFVPGVAIGPDRPIAELTCLAPESELAQLVDGVQGGLTGVMLLNDGHILGGDASFCYLGSYTSENGRWKGQILNQEHSPAREENPIFGGHEVGIGFSGTCDDQGALLEATALAGKRSLRMTAALKLMRRA